LVGLQVKWADPDLQRKKKTVLQRNNAENRMVSKRRHGARGRGGPSGSLLGVSCEVGSV
jgi:hypothetical protein